MRAVGFSVLLFILLLYTGNDSCRSASPNKEVSREEILAKVNGEIVTAGRFLDYLKQLKIAATKGEEPEKIKEERLNKLIREILIDQKAAALNLDTAVIFVERRDKHMQDFLLEHMYKKDIVEKISISDKQVRDHYEEYKEIDFLIPEEVKVSDLLIPVWIDTTDKDYRKKLKKADKKAKKKIEKFHKGVRDGRELSELCREYSKNGETYNMLNLGFVKRSQHSPEFDSAAFSLKEIGEVSKPVRDRRGYHLIQLTGRKEKSYVQLDSALFEGVREYLKNQKGQQAARQLADSLKRETEFVYNRDVINSDQDSFDDNMWVLIVDDRDTITFSEYDAAAGGYRFEAGIDSLIEEEKKFVLTNYLALPIILKKEAEKRGYADSIEYEVQRRAFTLEEARLRVKAQRTNKDFDPPTMEEMRAYYEAHKIDFPSLGVPVHVYHIVFDESLRAAEVLGQIERGADFAEMAMRYFPGEPEIKDVAYDLGFIAQGEMPDEFYQAALTLEDGQVGGPVRTKWGFHLIKVIEKKPEGNRFADIVPAIQRAINLEKRRNHLAQWEKSLFEEADIWISQDLLKRLELPKPEG
jgi:parvulin-like peptidyl-prolyl isomerase